jgi:hypothetical protein
VDRLAVDLTLGPRGHVGQGILLAHEENAGAEMLAASLTDFVMRSLRTFAALPGTFANPLKISELAGLKVLKLAPDSEVKSLGGTRTIATTRGAGRGGSAT